MLMADTRTNAGIDDFSTFRKLHVLCDGPDRQVYAATAGSLSLSQAAVGLVREHADRLDEAASMFAVARIVGEAVAEVGETTGAALAREHIDNTLEMLVAGYIGDGPLKLFLVYTIGNFIECTSDVPFLQIGETKYGRPILDRALAYETPLAQAVKIAFLSFDSTMESNLGVAHPLDLIVIRSNHGRRPLTCRIDEDDEYFRRITRGWAKILNDGVMSLSDPPWLDGD
jgi:putative proteasome-type protease